MGNINRGSALPAHSSLPPLRGPLPPLPFLTSSSSPEGPAQVTHGLRQWAAVSSQRSLMRVAPQKRWVRKKSPTCQGCELGRHSSAPMARGSAQLCPVGGGWEAEWLVKSQMGGLGTDAGMPRGQEWTPGGQRAWQRGAGGPWRGSIMAGRQEPHLPGEKAEHR